MGIWVNLGEKLKIKKKLGFWEMGVHGIEDMGLIWILEWEMGFGL